MPATPMSRRTAGTAPTLGTSPTAKRATRRGAAAPVDESLGAVSFEQLVFETRKLAAQSAADQQHFDQTTDLINDHATCLDALRRDISQMRNDMIKIVEDVGRNDDQLKDNLTKLEQVIAAQASDAQVLTEATKAAIVEAARSGTAETTSRQKEVYDQLASEIRSLDTRAGQSIAEIRKSVVDVQAEAMHHRIAELGSSMTALGADLRSSMTAMAEGIARRFETLDQSRVRLASRKTSTLQARATRASQVPQCLCKNHEGSTPRRATMRGPLPTRRALLRKLPQSQPFRERNARRQHRRRTSRSQAPA